MTTEKTQRINTFIALGVLAIVIAVVCVIGSLTYGRTNEIIQGQAEATEYRVSSKVPGRILEFRVKEGQMVKAGDTLAIIEAPEVMAKKAQAEAVKTQAIALNDKAEAGAREEQIRGAYELWQKSIVIGMQALLLDRVNGVSRYPKVFFTYGIGETCPPRAMMKQ